MSNTNYTVANPDVITKYKTAGDITNRVLKQVRDLAKDGSKLFDICSKGDELLEEELSKVYNSKKASKISKGIAFPTTVNPNNIPAHLSPVSAEDEANLELKNGDVVNVMLGVQIDGFPSIAAETFVVGESKESPVTGHKADLLHAAWKASEAAIRTFQPNNRNWDVTNIVDKVVKYYDCTALESMLTHNQERNVLYGPKEVILNPTKENKNQIDTFRFEENEVYGLDILVSTSADGKVKPAQYATSLYKLTGSTYSLKLKLSHQVLGELKEKSHGPFPININKLSDVRKARSGLIESVNHSIVLPYDIVTEKDGEYVAQFFTTFAITKNGIVKFTSPSFDAELYKTEKTLGDEAITQLISEPLKKSAKKKKSKKAAESSSA
ncbi:Piso0_003292 [Millerozyma farinosa CBS 7064]|uniref:Piso0_003292 protein n=1 Tax=Pichia sorbitophila (strain ATCC MYA-4447 / BCRC 22081 / CBS 7064 / NBRC 10061 / NRRL Y-12695) TaxID=559304 RepID=G8YHQ3_PICSO|nr:Piso0_003292 [Millerozyma farinosa CBS 7064]CCE80955.1 Piso0_003292 [Millerozyma farinosa CBS 7064]